MIMLNNSPVERGHSFKLLGVLLTTSLSWSEHITAVQCALKLANGCISLKLFNRSGMTSNDLLHYYGDRYPSSGSD